MTKKQQYTMIQAINERVDDAEQKLADATETVKAWLQDKIDTLCKDEEVIANTTNFLNMVPQYAQDAEYNDLVIRQSVKLNSAFRYDFDRFVTYTLDRDSIPENILSAFKVGKLLKGFEFGKDILLKISIDDANGKSLLYSGLLYSNYRIDRGDMTIYLYMDELPESEVDDIIDPVEPDVEEPTEEDTGDSETQSPEGEQTGS